MPRPASFAPHPMPPSWHSLSGARVRRMVLAGIAALLVFAAISVIHALVRGFADDVSLFQPYDVSRAEGLLFRGSPSAGLQSALGTTGASADVAFLVWRSLFFGPLLLVVFVAVVWGWRMALGLLTVHAALLFSADVVYAVIPTRPPWLDVDVVRMIAARRADGTQFDTNPLAALPSLHLGVIVAFGLWFAHMPRRSALWFGLAHGLWALAMTWSIVYTGEHYLVDAIAGAVWAAGAFYTVRALGLAYPRPEARQVAALKPDANRGAHQRAA